MNNSSVHFNNDFSMLQESYRSLEENAVAHLLSECTITPEHSAYSRSQADEWVLKIREESLKAPFIEAFMQHYNLSSKEGLLLMSLAEALLRIPDKETADLLIQDKLGQGDFSAYLKGSPSKLVMISTFALKVLTATYDSDEKKWALSRFRQALSATRDPVLRRGTFWAMRILSGKFVMGNSIIAALKHVPKDMAQGYTHSFDMLGEAALTEEDALRYYHSYLQAIKALGAFQGESKDILGAGISIKLSALHPRYEVAHIEDVRHRLGGRLMSLAQAAAHAGINLTIDAEEADRLELSLELFADLSGDSRLKDWQGLGLAVQAYQKRAPAVIDWLQGLAQRHNRRICVRLVKGAYWDTEIKASQEQGLEEYPVFTRKHSTDLSYLVCAQKILENPQFFYGAFATHNAMTVALIKKMAHDKGIHDYEFQRLYGMGEGLYNQLIGSHKENLRCRIYAPVGDYQDLLPYLVRRLLENGANSSFVNQVTDPLVSLDELNANPIDEIQNMTSIRHQAIPLPRHMYGERLNSEGFDLSHIPHLKMLSHAVHLYGEIQATPLGGTVQEAIQETVSIKIKAPFNHDMIVGTCVLASPHQAASALKCAQAYKQTWVNTPVEIRSAFLLKAAELLEARLLHFVKILVLEGGKTYADAIAEIREAVDFCRYYAMQAQKECKAICLPGPTGEENTLYLKGRGIFVCISPWNFPLAIFLGQIAAALVMGNVVIAKPATQTPLVAFEAIKLLYEAGIPFEALYFLPMKGQDFSQTIIQDPSIGGVVFTGSTETAWIIQQTLAAKRGPIVPFIAETGGQNAMIVDSSALIEQVVKDVVVSSFQSAGQRCSALRVLFVQEDIMPRFKEILKGAMNELHTGDPHLFSTDVGPVIDEISQKSLLDHAKKMIDLGFLLHQAHVKAEDVRRGTFVAPMVFELPDVSYLTQEHFGPLLHVLSFKNHEFDMICQTINDFGFGLTFGLHSRIDSRIQSIANSIQAGNIYINRNMIGAVVGVQPFGGMGLSGTGPKAGGPFYLHAFATEQTVCINTTAQGGNASLMASKEY